MDIPKAHGNRRYFLRSNGKGQFIIRTWELGEETERVVDLRKI